MKKYTIIYSETFNIGSRTNSITKMKHIESYPEKLKEAVEIETSWDNVWFIFDGHSEPTED